MANYQPKKVLRTALVKVFEDMRTVRAFEQLFDIVPINIDDSDNNASSIAKIQEYLINNIGFVEASGVTSNTGDTYLVKANTVDITLNLHTDASPGNPVLVAFIEGTHRCILNGNGNTIDGDATFEIFLGESLFLVPDSNNDWWAI